MEVSEIAAGRLVRVPPDLDVSVWRFVDLAKFVALLEARAIHFVRANLLGDPWEGAISAAGLAMRPAIAEAYAAATPGWTKEMFESMFEQVGDIRMREVMITCWHMNTAESAAMWGLYAPAGKGVAIRSTTRRLIAALPPQHEDSAITVSQVSYVDYSRVPVTDIADVFAPFLLKRDSFSHERELRAMLIHRDGPAVYPVPVDLGTLIEAVYVAPLSAGWERDVVQSIVSRYGLAVPVLTSALDDPAVR